MQQTVSADLSEDLSSLSSSSSSSTTTAAPSSTSTNPVPTCSDPCREAINRARSSNPAGTLVLGNLRFIYRLGSGDIGSVYLVEVKGEGGACFAAKVMDKKELAVRNKEGRATIERGILERLDHPFLPNLYATLECQRWLCLLTEFCPGGDLHVLRQRQPGRRFPEAAVRFYASEVIVALEYLHMMGIIYRDLKPENVLVRSDGHIMLTDFDLSLKCDTPGAVTAQIVSDDTMSMPMPCADDNNQPTGDATTAVDRPLFRASSCIIPSCIVPVVPCFHPKRRRRKKASRRQSIACMEIVAEPVDVRSMSFVGTHEYLAPEIVSGEGHGSAVDWWTLGIFMFEMLYGTTPFKGVDNDLTLANIVARALEFPKDPAVSGAVKELIERLLTKDPSRRMGSTVGATAVKRHPFFGGVNWALLRCTKPPHIPRPVNYKDLVQSHDRTTSNSVDYY